MKQSTLYIDYPYYEISFYNIASYKFIKECSELQTHMLIWTNDKRSDIHIWIGDNLTIRTNENGIQLTFKRPYDFNKFLEKNESALNLFKVTKETFKDIKGISNEPH